MADSGLPVSVRSGRLRKDRTQSPEFRPSQAAACLDELNALLSGTEQLRKEFVRLNGDALKDPARSFNEWTYYGKMRNLADILRNMQPH